MSKQIYMILAEYDGPAALLHAAEKVKNAGFKRFDTYSPFPIHGMDDAMGLGQSKLGWIVLVGGLTGAFTGFFLQTWVSVSAYPIVISGKPFFSYPAFIPVTFELMVLFSSFAAVFGMFGLNKLPRLHHPIFASETIKRATSHGFFLGINADDPLFNQERVNELFSDSGATHIEVIEE